MSRDNILVFCAAFPPPLHGHAIVTSQIFSQIVERYPARNIFKINTSPQQAKKHSPAYHVRRSLSYLTACFTLLRLAMLFPRKPRALYTVYEAGFGSVYTAIIVGLAGFCGYRVVLHHHTSAHLVSRQWRFRLISSALREDAENIVLSSGMANSLRKIYGEHLNVKVVLNQPPDAPALHAMMAHQRSETGVGKVRLGMLSTLSEEKGASRAIDVLRTLRDAGLECHLALAGPIVDSQTRQSVNTAISEFGDRFEYLGQLTGTAKLRFFCGVDGFLFPTRYRNEAQPLVLMEALACSLPIYTFDTGYIREIVPPTSIFNSTADIANAIKRSFFGSKELVLLARHQSAAQYQANSKASEDAQRQLISTLVEPQA